MSSPFFTASNFISYWFKAVGAHDLHSPFVFDLYNKVIRKSKSALPKELQAIRSQLIRDDRSIDVIDFKTGKSRRSTVGSVAKTSLSSTKFMNFLRLLSEYVQTSTILETGTSLGLNAISLSQAIGVNTVVSIEGSEIIHQLAVQNCRDNSKVHLIKGDLYETFSSALIRYQPEIIFLDADHRSSAIRHCLGEIALHCPDVKCIVIHDVHWSKDMLEGWESITEDPKYSLTMDIFQAGLIFPNHPIVKQHFTLRF